MSSWTDGYVSDIQYTAGFYRELSPGYLSALLNVQGYRAPDPAATFTYCELACGQGFGTNILAASYPHGQFWGYDFNPAQIANATRLARNAGLSNITFGEESFESLVRSGRTDIPMFDYITLHGIYSWISAENRGYIIDFISRHLKPGGVVYVSYNCLPGWASVAPLQRLMREHAALHPGRSDRQVEGAMAFIDRLKEAGAGYFTVNPSLASRMDSMKNANRHYLAHEYLNGYWFPLYHADVVRELDRAKLNFVASATVLDNIDTFSVPEAVRKVLADVTDPVLYQTVKDYTINQAFRKDVFVRGAAKLNRLEHDAALRALTFTSILRRQDHTLEFRTPLGNAAGAAAVYEPIFDAIADQTIVSLADLLQVPALKTQGLSGLVQAFQLMLSSAHIHPTLPRAVGSAAARFNRAVAEEIVAGTDYGVLAAPVIGTGLATGFVEACSIPALCDNPAISAEALRDIVWGNMARAGRRLIKDGKQVESAAENLAGLTEPVQRIIDARVPLWRKLGIL